MIGDFPKILSFLKKMGVFWFIMGIWTENVYAL